MFIFCFFTVLYVKLLYVKFVYVKLLYVKFVCVKLLYVKFVCVKVREAAGGGGEGARDTESKTRTPHKVVGKKPLTTSHDIACALLEMRTGMEDVLERHVC